MEDKEKGDKEMNKIVKLDTVMMDNAKEKPKIDTSKQTPIEIALGIDEYGMTTARKLYAFLELDPTHYAKWFRKNITGNEFADKDVDFKVLALKCENPKGGRPTQDAKLSAGFAKKLSMMSKSEKGEQAANYFTRFWVEEQDRKDDLEHADQLLIFQHQEFGSVRTLIIDDEPWFCGKDVAGNLGYSNEKDAIKRHCDEGEVVKHALGVQTGVKKDGTPAMMTVNAFFVNESGLYSLIFGSKLESAKRFKRWVTSEVLPSIRKTGSYSVHQKPDSYMIDDRIERAKRWIEEEQERVELREKNIELVAENASMKPKAQFYDLVMSSTDCITIEEMAKLLNTPDAPLGRTRLYKWLRENKFLKKDNLPYQRYINQGYFTLHEYTYADKKYHQPRICTQARITPLGQNAIARKWAEVHGWCYA